MKQNGRRAAGSVAASRMRSSHADIIPQNNDVIEMCGPAAQAR